MKNSSSFCRIHVGHNSLLSLNTYNNEINSIRAVLLSGRPTSFLTPNSNFSKHPISQEYFSLSTDKTHKARSARVRQLNTNARKGPYRESCRAIKTKFIYNHQLKNASGGVAMDFSIKILNFEKYNPRKDVKKPSWFRFDHDFFENHNFFIFSPAERLAWIYLLCLASRENTDVVPIYYSHAEKIGGLTPDVLDSAIVKLSRLGVMSRCKSNTRTGKSNTHSHATRRDETNITGRDETGHNETSGAPAPNTFHPLINLWNDNCGSLKKIQKTTPERDVAIKANWGKLSPDEWVVAIQKAADSDFCNARGDDWTWKATFDWFLRKKKKESANYIKVFEGNYDNDRFAKNKTKALFKSEENVQWANTIEGEK